MRYLLNITRRCWFTIADVCEDDGSSHAENWYYCRRFALVWRRLRITVDWSR